LARKEIVLMDYFENEIERPDWLGYWRLKKKLLQGLLDQCEISLQQILTAPEKQDQTAVYYCPFCKTEYRQKRHDCVDCEIALKEFDSGKRAISVDAAHSY
jgi:transcription initiation factor IIE alpha subunit